MRGVRIARALCRVALAAILACIACGDREDATVPEVAAEDLEHLRELGYAEWVDAPEPDRRGVTVYEVDRAAHGYNLYTNDADEAYLLDMAGNRVHTWRLPGKTRCEHVEWVGGGRIVLVCLSEALAMLDWSSRVEWELSRKVHHDVAVPREGPILFPMRKRPKLHHGRQVNFDRIGSVSQSGRFLGGWTPHGRLDDMLRLHGPTALDRPPANPPGPDEVFDYYHMNSIEILPETPLGERDARFRAGNLLVCLRNVNLVLILDPETHTILWHWGQDVLDMPHMPTMLPDGNILVFDNGPSRRASRVLEIEPVSSRVVWKYAGTPEQPFYSRRRGSAQRLANGNTLVCESDRGRAFEVTREGRTVWEFWNPELRDDKRKGMYRFTRIPSDEVEPLLDPLP